MALPNDANLTEFCAVHDDDRFPPEFLKNFIAKLEAAKLEVPQVQPDPRKVMDSHFKYVKAKMKKRAKAKQSIIDAATEKSASEKAASEKASKKASMSASRTIEENLEIKRQNKKKAEEAGKKLKEEKALDLKMEKGKKVRERNRVIKENKLQNCSFEGEPVSGHKGGGRT